MILYRPGDILLYRDPPNFSTRLIIDGERMEDPDEHPYYYHVAIVLNTQLKIEAQGKNVAVARIDNGGVFDCFRAPIPRSNIDDGLDKIRKYVGQPYDWSAIVDDALRYLTCGIVHLPEKFVLSMERHRKICSTLVSDYFKAAQWGPKFGLGVSPQDIYDAVKDWPVN